MSDPDHDPDEKDQPFEEIDQDEPFEEIGRTDPFAELDDEGDPLEDPFEEMDDEMSIENVWETLGEEGGEVDSTLAPVEGEGGPDVETVEKRSFCQRCRYLSAPPTVECTHEGTEILEVVDSNNFRVQNCPMIERGGPESSTR
ncbi:hypothetical protein AArcSl_0278 [Halalkaliarchaeum desulfuricum]|uniref:DUF8135 domain-containing protein n=1 Tax=Halalkaliarchaeum desulfuricum TaxID=2055893 RepID=A0A343TFR1_9EURY|nr:hypothetical protein [Halalkaliarchaeum desulfuricum]AUX07933.1 hypothetical protein AArcSl_0278 [Halalkaliarchaeum desulfuricum]